MFKVLKCFNNFFDGTSMHSDWVGRVVDVENYDSKNYCIEFDYELKRSIDDSVSLLILKRDCEVLPDEFKVRIIKYKNYWYRDSVGEIFTVRYLNSHTGVFITTVDGIGECGIDYEDCEILPEEPEKRVKLLTRYQIFNKERKWVQGT
jgi:hypothetical protein